MKILLLICIILLSFSCSKKESNCRAEEQAIRIKYVKLIKLAGNDQDTINALYTELNAKLANVCK